VPVPEVTSPTEPKVQESEDKKSEETSKAKPAVSTKPAGKANGGPTTPTVKKVRGDVSNEFSF